MPAAKIRIVDRDEGGIGEIELRGPSITAGYIDNPEANHSAFTADGWFRTGDIGFVDSDGFLFVTGRSKEVLVLGGGKKVDPEDLERTYGAAPEISEMAVLEERGGIVALVRPDTAKLRERGATNLRDGIRIVLGERTQALPSYERLAGFALTDTPLPRTRLGKYRRFLLPELYRQAAGAGTRRPPHAPGPDDAALLANPTAAAIWNLLRRRCPEAAIDLDLDLALDLGLDSLAWMELTLLLHNRLGVSLSDADLAELRTIRDLLRHAAEAPSAGAKGATAAASNVEQWLAPVGPALKVLRIVLYGLDRTILRTCFGLRVSGLEHLPASGPFIVAPNHASYLDAPAIAASLPLRRLSKFYWAGDRLLLFSSLLRRWLSRALQIFPVDGNHPGEALTAAARVLALGNTVVWFAEGWRSPDGNVQRFLPGVGELLGTNRTQVVPVYIGGTFAAWPRTRRLPRCRPISITFGSPLSAEELRTIGAGDYDDERIANGLCQYVLSLAVSSTNGAQNSRDLSSILPKRRMIYPNDIYIIRITCLSREGREIDPVETAEKLV